MKRATATITVALFISYGVYGQAAAAPPSFEVASFKQNKGVFNLELKWTPDEDKADGPSFFTAVQEQLGLKLEPRKGPMGIIVVDNAERAPTGN
jgi:hypothetical protein